jgi:phenylpropionate dioxygenase-like ring-hydroxylating dioxygenase large terminal subunit
MTRSRLTTRPSPTPVSRPVPGSSRPWYPVVEYNGLLFTYMGPVHKQPVFPLYDIFDGLDADTEEIVIIDHFAFGGPSIAPCNWFQAHENVMDPFHVFILHNAISGHQFDPRLDIWPRIEWQRHEWGTTSTQDRQLPDGTTLHRVTETRMPTTATALGSNSARKNTSASRATTKPRSAKDR